jgi:hypothetical protein
MRSNLYAVEELQFSQVCGEFSTDTDDVKKDKCTKPNRLLVCTHSIEELIVVTRSC